MPILSNQKFGRLTAVQYSKGYWLCDCECGNRKSIYAGNLRSGATRSCGCLNADLARSRNAVQKRTHGKTKTPEFRVWQGMRQRCENPNDKSYRDYGGRGIRVCGRWSSFESFYSDMGPRPSRGFSLDRINVDGDYAPRNCRWATSKEQNNNRRNTLKVDGVPLALIVGDSHSAEYQRLRRAALCQ